MYGMINLSWNMMEYLMGPRTPLDILWLYTGFVNDSMMFNIVEYICKIGGLI